MKCVILAGGRGTRISEETVVRPKPLIEIGGRPLLWHIMQIFGAHGIHDFIVCLGYKGYLIKEYFANYYLHNSDMTVNLSDNTVTVHRSVTEPWNVTLVNTGEETLTGGRLKRVQRYLGDEPFCFTYGDGLSDVDITALVAHHGSTGKIATVTAVQPPGRYGSVVVGADHCVLNFQEKPLGDNAWISGGFFVLQPEIFSYVDGDSASFEGASLERLTSEGNLSAFRHSGFWHAVDTMRDKDALESLWAAGRAPWKVWAT
ncbi:MAG: glucose-1-phosphate cytidylyltransferase [Candidatus Velthaea sp.]